MADTATDIRPRRIVDEDGATVEIFDLPTDEASLEALLRELFEQHWREITFGPIIQGAAWEMRADAAPEKIKMFDGYLTVTFGVPHLHRQASRPPQQQSLAGARASSPDQPRRALSALEPRRHANFLGSSPVQRQGRAADHRAAAQSVPPSGDRQGAEDAGLVAPRAVGRAQAHPPRPPPARSFRPLWHGLPTRVE